MKLSRWQLALALGISIWSTSAHAQSPTHTANYAIAAEYGQMSISDVQPALAAMPSAPSAMPAAKIAAAGCTTPGCTDPGCAAAAGCTTAPAGSCTAAPGTASGTGSDDCALDCPTSEPWRLFGNYNENNCHGNNIRGWVNGGIMANADHSPSNYNGPVTFYDRDNEGQLSQIYLISEKTLDTSDGAAFGYRLDAMYGTDYRFNISRGLTADDNFTAKAHSSRFYGLDIPQAYAEVGKGDTSLKVGHFYTLIGYEVVTAPDNFFMSHSYTMQYGEPFTHTGALVTHKFNDQFTVSGGVTTGWDNFEDVYNQLSFLGAATFSSSDGHSKLAYAAHVGEEETLFGTINPNETRFVQSLVFSRTLTDRLNYVVQSDFGTQQQAQQYNGVADAEWYGVNQYLFYKFNCAWTAGVRAEWFRDDDGVRVAPPGDYAQNGTNSNPAGVGGFEGNFYELAFGLNYKPAARPNLTVRPEVRYDRFDGTATNGTVAQPYSDGQRNNQLIYGIDLIYLY